MDGKMINIVYDLDDNKIISQWEIGDDGVADKYKECLYVFENDDGHLCIESHGNDPVDALMRIRTSMVADTEIAADALLGFDQMINSMDKQ